MFVDVFIGPCFVEKERFQFDFRLPYTFILFFHYRRFKSSCWFRRNVQAPSGHFRPFRGKCQCFELLNFEEEHLQHPVPEKLVKSFLFDEAWGPIPPPTRGLSTKLKLIALGDWSWSAVSSISTFRTNQFEAQVADISSMETLTGDKSSKQF